MIRKKLSLTDARFIGEIHRLAAEMLAEVEEELILALPAHQEEIRGVFYPNIAGLRNIASDPNYIQEKYQQMQKRKETK